MPAHRTTRSNFVYPIPSDGVTKRLRPPQQAVLSRVLAILLAHAWKQSLFMALSLYPSDYRWLFFTVGVYFWLSLFKALWPFMRPVRVDPVRQRLAELSQS